MHFEKLNPKLYLGYGQNILIVTTILFWILLEALPRDRSDFIRSDCEYLVALT